MTVEWHNGNLIDRGVFRFVFLVVLSVFPLLLLADTNKSAYPPRPIEFGVFPHRSTGHLEDTFGVIAQRFSRSLNRRVNFNAQLSFDFFNEDLSTGFYDVVFLQPFDYVSAHAAHGYDVIATQTDSLKALLVVRPSSNIRTIADMQGRKIILPPENTAISYLVRDWLKEKDLLVGRDVSIEYESSHVACLQKALLGFGVVCGTAKPVLGFFKDQLGFDYITIAETKEIPHTLFAIHPRVSVEERNKILEVILHLHEGKDGKKLMKEGRFSVFRRAEDHEYDLVRKMLGEK